MTRLARPLFLSNPNDGGNHSAHENQGESTNEIASNSGVRTQIRAKSCDDRRIVNSGQNNRFQRRNSGKKIFLDILNFD